MLRVEARNAETPIERKPPWIKVKATMGPHFTQLRGLVEREGLHTVCQEAGCPNIFECWEDREATFLIGGDQCTRRCDFCQIDTGKPQPLDRDEPRRVAESVRTMGLRYATITGVARDDLHEAGCELITITQYLRPSPRHHPVERWVKPEEFVELAAEAEEIGFAGVMSGPLVRSSYRAGRLYQQAVAARETTDA